jgi:hypothetical protein
MQIATFREEKWRFEGNFNDPRSANACARLN